MIAVLYDVVDCIERYRLASDPKGHQLFREAERWLLADETEWPYSFQCICEVLDLNARVVLRHLQVAAARM
ncbi:MAG TPA: hypothetical protein VMW17_10545 [Candidatus Binatia bacterium]|nr:hypothetical protein [Candidatus Binatia bacterium]